MSVTKQHVLSIYQRIVSTAKRRYEHNRYESSLQYIRASALWAYSFNFFYSDENVEYLLKHIADKKLGGCHIQNPENDKFVFIDSFAFDNRGLTQQYLRAMMSMNISILYIVTKHDFHKGKDIFRELQEYSKATIYTIKKGQNNLAKSQSIIEEIKKFAPSKIFLHLTPWDVSALMAIYKISNVVKYNINLTDHAFWLGASFIDYNIEFRAYGKTVSLEKRGLSQMQEICLPYYPVLPKWSEFKGFPEIPNDSVTILTGGAPYKMLGRNDVFFSIMDQLLAISSRVRIIIAGVEPSYEIFKEKITRMRNGKRVLLIGNRTDINECFVHCDMFLGTYPTIGGLMTQYAAINAKPILAYRDPDDTCNSQVEDVVNQCKKAVHTYSDKEEFLHYAKRLIEDQLFRVSEGRNNRDALITSDTFNQEFSNLVCDESTTQWNWERIHVDYKAVGDRYLKYECENDRWKRTLISILKLKTLALYPQLFSSIIRVGFQRLTIH